MVKTVLLECFIKVIKYYEYSIRVYRSSSNINFYAGTLPNIFSYLLCLSSWSLRGACSILIQLPMLQHV